LVGPEIGRGNSTRGLTGSIGFRDAKVLIVDGRDLNLRPGYPPDPRRRRHLPFAHTAELSRAGNSLYFSAITPFPLSQTQSGTTGFATCSVGISAMTNLRKMREKSMTLLRAAILAVCLAGVAACNTEGPAERAGEKVDNAGQAMQDKIDPPGPVEQMGRSIDRATQ
jgi:predicted small secreted protein